MDFIAHIGTVLVLTVVLIWLDLAFKGHYLAKLVASLLVPCSIFFILGILTSQSPWQLISNLFLHVSYP